MVTSATTTITLETMNNTDRHVNGALVRGTRAHAQYSSTQGTMSTKHYDDTTTG